MLVKCLRIKMKVFETYRDRCRCRCQNRGSKIRDRRSTWLYIYYISKMIKIIKNILNLEIQEQKQGQDEK